MSPAGYSQWHRPLSGATGSCTAMTFPGSDVTGDDSDNGNNVSGALSLNGGDRVVITFEITSDDYTGSYFGLYSPSLDITAMGGPNAYPGGGFYFGPTADSAGTGTATIPTSATDWYVWIYQPPSGGYNSGLAGSGQYCVIPASASGVIGCHLRGGSAGDSAWAVTSGGILDPVPISDSANVTVDWDTSAFVVGDTIVIPSNGLYLFACTASCVFAVSPSAAFNVDMQVTGDGVPAFDSRVFPSGALSAAPVVIGTQAFRCAAGNTFHITVDQGPSGQTLHVAEIDFFVQRISD